MPAKPPVQFVAIIPMVDTAIRIAGDEGARLTLDIADSDLPDFLPIIRFRNCRIRVTVEEAP